jgi:hypothetical protein
VNLLPFCYSFLFDSFYFFSASTLSLPTTLS